MDSSTGNVTNKAGETTLQTVPFLIRYFVAAYSV